MNLRELDALIGEHIFGFKIIDYKVVGRVDKHIETKDGGIIVLPQYSSHIASAWEVVEKMESSNFDVDITLRSSLQRGCRMAPKGEFNTTNVKFVSANKMELAICLSALKAKGIDASEWEVEKSKKKLLEKLKMALLIT